jgi:hypothetical protein
MTLKVRNVSEHSILNSSKETYKNRNFGRLIITGCRNNSISWKFSEMERSS